MATAVIAGLAAFGATTGFGATAAAGIGLAAAAATAGMEYMMKPEEQKGEKMKVQLGDSGAGIDKTAMQQQTKLGKLELGEGSDKAKRKKGKAKFKIALDKKKKDASAPAPSTGLSGPKGGGGKGIQL